MNPIHRRQHLRSPRLRFLATAALLSLGTTFTVVAASAPNLSPEPVRPPQPPPPWINGTPGADEMNETYLQPNQQRRPDPEGNELLDGKAGDDKIWGYGGNDWIVGNAGADAVDGGGGNDSIEGGGGNDILSGVDGNDHMLGGDQDDQL